MFSGYIAPGLREERYSHRGDDAWSLWHERCREFYRRIVRGAFHRHGGLRFSRQIASGGARSSRWSLLWYTAANIVMAFQDTALEPNLWRFIAGIGIGGGDQTIGTYISEPVPKHVRGRARPRARSGRVFCAVPIVAVSSSYLLVPHRYFGLDGWRSRRIDRRGGRDRRLVDSASACRRVRAGSRKKAASTKRTRS